MNIVPKYSSGMMLEEGGYNIRVDKPGYNTYDEWIEVDGNTIHNVILERESADDKYPSEILIDSEEDSVSQTILADLDLTYDYEYWLTSEIPNTEQETKGLNLATFKIDFSNGGLSRWSRVLPSITYRWTPDSSREQKELIRILEENENNENELFSLRGESRLPVEWYINGIAEEDIFSSENNNMASIYLAYQTSHFFYNLKTEVDRYYNDIRIKAGDVISTRVDFEEYTLAGEIKSYKVYGNEYITDMYRAGIYYEKYTKPWTVMAQGENIDSYNLYDFDFENFGLMMEMRSGYSDHIQSVSLRRYLSLPVSGNIENKTDDEYFENIDLGSIAALTLGFDFSYYRAVIPRVKVGGGFSYKFTYFWERVDSDTTYGVESEHIFTVNAGVNVML